MSCPRFFAVYPEETPDTFYSSVSCYRLSNELQVVNDADGIRHVNFLQHDIHIPTLYLLQHATRHHVYLLLCEIGKLLLDGRVEQLFFQALDRDGEIKQ